MLVSVCCAALVILPHLLGLWHDAAHALAWPMKLSGADVARSWAATGKALQSLVIAALVFGTPLVAAFGVLFCRSLRVEERALDPVDSDRLLARMLAIVLVLCLGLSVATQAQFKSRWLQPLLIGLPIWLVLRLRDRLDAARLKWLNITACAVAVGVLVAVPAIPRLAPWTGKFTRLNAPYDALAGQFKSQGLRPRTILADSRLLGGNLKMHFPDAQVVVPELPIRPSHLAAPALAVWDRTRQTEPSPALTNLVWRFAGCDLARAVKHKQAAPLKHAQTQQMTVGYVVLPGERGGLGGVP
jgi:hypothetical protein